MVVTVDDIMEAFPELVEIRIPIEYIGGAMDGERHTMKLLTHRTQAALFFHPGVKDVKMPKKGWHCWTWSYQGGLEKLMRDVVIDTNSGGGESEPKG